MGNFRKARSLSEIMEESQKIPIVIFKYSSECNSSTSLAKELAKLSFFYSVAQSNDVRFREKNITLKKLSFLIYKVVVQDQPALTKNIAEFFEVKHQSPQILIINKCKLTHTAHHNFIKIENFIFL